MIKAINFVSIPVSDQDRALKFYTEVLGFQLATDAPLEEGQRWIELLIPGAETKVVLHTPKGHEDRVGSFQNLAFVCDDVLATYEDLKGRGAEFKGPPTEAPWGAMVLLKDSEGNTLCLATPT